MRRETLERNNNNKTTIERRKDKTNAEPWRNVVKLGSKLGDSEDILYRKEISNIAMNKMSDMDKEGKS